MKLFGKDHDDGGLRRDEAAPAAEVVRHEEEAVVSTRVVPAESARLRKRIVEEEVTLTVVLRREEVVLERAPYATPAPAASDQAGSLDGLETSSDPDAIAGSVPAEPAHDGVTELSEDVVEMVLHAEEPVVGTRVVPKERVVLRREVVAEELPVSTELRKEVVEVERPVEDPVRDVPPAL